MQIKSKSAVTFSTSVHVFHMEKRIFRAEVLLSTFVTPGDLPRPFVAEFKK